MLVNGASAQGYTVSRVGDTGTLIVTVSRNCSIPVSEFATKLDKNVKVYGNAECGGNGQRFASNTKNKNEPSDLKGFAFEKMNNISPAIVKIVFKEIKDSVTLNFYKAEWKVGQGFCPGETFPVIFRKRIDSSQSNTGEKSLTIENLYDELYNVRDKTNIMDRDVEKHNEVMRLIPVGS